ncbi:MAG TPA: hypothetical protein VFW96_28470 [Thermomicrobiales bacterium]|nr:hypothetical protein [Thermomicrobiales bacterium]
MYDSSNVAGMQYGGVLGNTSGQGPGAAVPAEIQGWNWGAFLLNWIWGIGNGVMIALLALIPFVNLAVAIYLGVKGSELAWQSKQWESLEQFQSVQKKWSTAGLIVLAASLLLSCGSCVLIVMLGALSSASS